MGRHAAAAAVLVLVAAQAGAAVAEYRVDAFAQPGDDDRATINRAFAAMHGLAGPKRLAFAARTYRIAVSADPGYEPILSLSDVADLEVDGAGAVIQADDMLGVRGGYLLGCRGFARLVLRGLRITYRPLPFVQGRIVAVDQPANRVTVRLDHGFDGIADLRRSPTTGIWCRAGLPEAAHLPRPSCPSWLPVRTSADGRIDYEAGPSGLSTMHAGGFDLGKTIGGAYTWQVGDSMVVWQRGAQDAVAAWEGRELRLEDIVIDSALHFAIKIRGVHGVTVDRCRIEPAPGAAFSGSADGIDVQQCRRVEISGCRIIANGDDAISLLNHGHGHNGETVETRFGPPLPDTNEDVRIVGNHIEGGNRNGMLVLATRASIQGNTVRSVRQYGVKCTGDDARIEGNRFMDVGSFTAYRHITDEIDTGIIGSDVWLQRRWTVRGNRIEGWYHMPGILLTSVQDALVEGNIFSVGTRTAAELHPHNPGMQRNAAIGLRRSSFAGKDLSCSDIRLQDNTLDESPLVDPLFVDGRHAWTGAVPGRSPASVPLGRDAP